MTKRIHMILLCLLLNFAFCTLAGAEELPELPVDPTVQIGTLPNGTHYYVIRNTVSKGTVDFALVQKSGKKIEMDSLSRFGGLSPLKFFVKNEAIPGNGGYFETRSGASVFRIQDVMIAEREEQLDSCLLVLMGMADEFAAMKISPSQSAVVVSGDVDEKKVVEKLRLLSYMTPYLPPPSEESPQWTDAEPEYSVLKTDGTIADLRFEWRLPGTPKELMQTTQPVVHNRLMDELCLIAADRVRVALQKDSIPYASIGARHVSSAETVSDEKFEIRVSVSADMADDAVKTIAGTLSSVAREGVSEAEFRRATSAFFRRLESLSGMTTNAVNTDRCINAFVNGAYPVSPSELLKYHSSRYVSDSLGSSLLTRMAEAVMLPDANLSVSCVTPEEMSQDTLRTMFDEGWKNIGGKSYRRHFKVSDTLYRYTPASKPFLKSARKEHLAGGTVWTFAGGFRVIYKRMDTGGRFYWSMGLEGGYGSIADLSRGEGAYVAEMMRLYNISGMPWDDFLLFLESNGITMDVSVGMSKTILSGVAERNSLPLLMRSILAVANEREPDEEAFAQYRRTLWLALEKRARDGQDSAEIIDSLMCPGYRYSRIKTKHGLTAEVQRKADRLFNDRFSMMNDGVLVILGDMDETLLRKAIQPYVPAFRTRDAVSLRPLISYQPTAGAMTHKKAGDRNAVYVAMSTILPMTAENVMAAELAGIMLEKKLASALAYTGARAKVSYDMKMIPNERFNVMIVVDDSSEESLAILREALSTEALQQVEDAQVNAYKAWLKNTIAVKMKDPQYWTKAILMRYLDGKDFTTDYASRIDGVSGAKVRDILVSLVSSGKVEYIIEKK